MSDRPTAAPISLERRRVSAEIKLLRLSLVPGPKSFCEEIGDDWIHAQPEENLSPAKAAAYLGIEEWAPSSAVAKKYETLQRRYPPEQFPNRHVDWRPAADLLSNPKLRLNWFWQSGLIPNPNSKEPHSALKIWDENSVEKPLTPIEILKRMQECF